MLENYPNTHIPGPQAHGHPPQRNWKPVTHPHPNLQGGSPGMLTLRRRTRRQSQVATGAPTRTARRPATDQDCWGMRWRWSKTPPIRQENDTAENTATTPVEGVLWLLFLWGFAYLFQQSRKTDDRIVMVCKDDTHTSCSFLPPVPQATLQDLPPQRSTGRDTRHHHHHPPAALQGHALDTLGKGSTPQKSAEAQTARITQPQQVSS